MFDVIIVGGSSAGLSAALILGRALRNVLVFDDAQPCNRFSHASHGFLTRDGIAPADLVRIGREQLAQYETVQLKDATVTQITPYTEGFEVLANGETYKARKILLATGIKDDLPPLKNIEQFWGTSVFHCPYCDGWEVRNQPFVIYGHSPTAFHQVKIVQHWASHVTFITDGTLDINDETRGLYARHNIDIVEKPIAYLEGEDGCLRQIVFEDGSSLACATMFTQPIMSYRAPFAEQLGCKMTEHNRIVVDTLGRTSVPSVYVAGDAATLMRSVPQAVAQGNAAGAGINADLIEEEFV